LFFAEEEREVPSSHQSRPKTPPTSKPNQQHRTQPTKTHNVAAEEPGYVTYESAVSYKPNIIYDNEQVEVKHTQI
jgi:hypothetical protein